MVKATLVKKLKKIAEEFSGDPEAAHVMADELLLEYINEPTVSLAYNEIDKWYA